MKTFDDFSEAFDYCREKDEPVVVVVLDEKYEAGEYKLYPSGTAKMLCSYEVVENTTSAEAEVGQFLVQDKHIRKEHEPERA